MRETVRPRPRLLLHTLNLLIHDAVSISQSLSTKRTRQSGKKKPKACPGRPARPFPPSTGLMTFVPIENLLSTSFLFGAWRLLAPSPRAAGRLRSPLGSYKFHNETRV